LKGVSRPSTRLHYMTSRERLIKVIKGEIPDHVPVSPDTSNMIPVRLTGRPFWDVYLYEHIPKWKAYINCVKHFGFDSMNDGLTAIRFEELNEIDHDWEEVIVFKNEERIITQKYREANNKKQWAKVVKVYYRGNPPTNNVEPDKVKLPLIPDKYEKIEGRQTWPDGEALLKQVKEEMGDHGLVGVACGTASLLYNVNDIYEYYDDPEKVYKRRDLALERFVKRFNKLMSLECRPDFISTGASGAMVFQTPQMFRELSLPIVKEITKLCKVNNIPSHIHCCGPEKELVKIVAEETDITIIDPLEIPPMGDCNLKEIKKLYGGKLVLKGNLHTTDIILRGTVKNVIEASKKAIDDAAEGGRFILSTGDQCGRDTPDENIYAMIETAKTYGKY